MSVENIIYIILFVIVFAVSTYRNYKKQEEQRKKAAEARRRHTDMSESQRPSPTPQSKTTFEEVLGDLLDFPGGQEYIPYEQPPVEKYEEPKPVESRNPEPVYKNVPAELVKKEQKYKADLPEEVTKGRALHALHHHKIEFYHEEENTIDFDLRQAIIHQIILEPKFKA